MQDSQTCTLAFLFSRLVMMLNLWHRAFEDPPWYAHLIAPLCLCVPKACTMLYNVTRPLGSSQLTRQYRRLPKPDRKPYANIKINPRNALKSMPTVEVFYVDGDLLV